MKDTEYTNKIDDLGRIVIPKQIRRDFGIGLDSNMRFYIGSNGELVIKENGVELSKVDMIIDLITDGLKKDIEFNIIGTNDYYVFRENGMKKIVNGEELNMSDYEYGIIFRKILDGEFNVL